MLSKRKWSSLNDRFYPETLLVSDIFSTMKNEIRFGYLEFGCDFYGLIFQQKEADYNGLSSGDKFTGNL